jgi:hypothetical protein
MTRRRPQILGGRSTARHRTFASACLLGEHHGLLTLVFDGGKAHWRAFLVVTGTMSGVRRSARQATPMAAALQALGAAEPPALLAKFCAECERAVVDGSEGLGASPPR